jgi:hypothetical protein
MPPQLPELETVLGQLVIEYRRLLLLVEHHAQAVRTLNLPAMAEAARHQEAVRLRIGTLDRRRKSLAQQLVRGSTPNSEITLRQLAALYPAKSQSLLKLRVELKGVVDQIATKSRISGKVASAVLGHLNTVVRLISGAAEKAGLYTKHGTPRISVRIGMIEAVG